MHQGDCEVFLQWIKSTEAKAVLKDNKFALVGRSNSTYKDFNGAVTLFHHAISCHSRIDLLLPVCKLDERSKELVQLDSWLADLAGALGKRLLIEPGKAEVLASHTAEHTLVGMQTYVLLEIRAGMECMNCGRLVNHDTATPLNVLDAQRSSGTQIQIVLSSSFGWAALASTLLCITTRLETMPTFSHRISTPKSRFNTSDSSRWLTR